MNDEEIKPDACIECLQRIREFVIRMIKDQKFKQEADLYLMGLTLRDEKLRPYFQREVESFRAWHELYSPFMHIGPVPFPEPTDVIKRTLEPKWRFVWGFYSTNQAIMAQTTVIKGFAETLERDKTDIILKVFRDMVFKTPF